MSEGRVKRESEEEMKNGEERGNERVQSDLVRGRQV